MASLSPDRARWKTVLKGLGIVVIVLVACFLLNLALGGRFLTLTNINAVLSHAIIVSFTAWVYSFIFALGYMDLSLGAAIILGVQVAGELGNRIGAPGVLIGGIVAGIAFMVINFNIFAWTKIPSWIAGLGMCMLYEAITVRYGSSTVDKMTVLLQDEYRIISKAPFIYILFAVGFIFAYMVYNRTSIGLNARAIGSNASVAKGMGISVPKTLILTGVVCGILLGCAIALQSSYNGRIISQSGMRTLTTVFQPLAALLLAQAIQKKINIIIAIPLCSLLIYVCFNVMTMLGVPSGSLQEFCLGVLVVVFGILSSRGKKGVVK